MEHDEFAIGTEFYVAGKAWLCTDVGTRVVVAIRLKDEGRAPYGDRAH